MEIPDTPLCGLIKYISDEELKFLLESPTDLPEVVGLSEHLDNCEECSKRLSKIKLFE